MRFPKKTATEEVVEKISKLKGPNKTEQGGLIWLASAFAEQDVQLQRRSGRIARNMLLAFNKAFPEVDGQLIGDIVADLDSLWDTGQKLDNELKRLFQMRFPPTLQSSKRVSIFHSGDSDRHGGVLDK